MFEGLGSLGSKASQRSPSRHDRRDLDAENRGMAQESRVGLSTQRLSFQGLAELALEVFRW
jgi:hypothetical protein